MFLLAHPARRTILRLYEASSKIYLCKILLNSEWLQENMILPDFIKCLVDINEYHPAPSTSTQYVSPAKVSIGFSTKRSLRKPFFADPNMTAEVTGISEDLIMRFAIILEAISSGYHIDTATKKTLSGEAQNLYLFIKRTKTFDDD